MGRAPCCDKANVKKGPWSPEEDAKLKEYMDKYGTGGNWITLPQKAGLRRCGKSCRLRWLNYLRPNIKHGDFSEEEDRIICSLYTSIGSRWSIIAAQLPGRTDNDIKNYWNTKLKKKLLGMVPPLQKRLNQAAAAAAETTYPPFWFLRSPSASSPYLSPSPALSSTASTYNYLSNNYYPTKAGPFTGYQNTAATPSSLLVNTTSLSTITFQAQDGSVQNCGGLTFGGEASCSSSTDRSSSNQISSHGKELEYNDHGRENLDLQGYEGQEFILQTSNNHCNGYGNAADDQKPNGYSYSENPLDYKSLEEMKQLISTNICNNLSLFLDENKTEEKGLLLNGDAYCSGYNLKDLCGT